jgi:hypothetical protein
VLRQQWGYERIVYQLCYSLFQRQRVACSKSPLKLFGSGAKSNWRANSKHARVHPKPHHAGRLLKPALSDNALSLEVQSIVSCRLAENYGRRDSNGHVSIPSRLHVRSRYCRYLLRLSTANTFELPEITCNSCNCVRLLATWNIHLRASCLENRRTASGIVL